MCVTPGGATYVGQGAGIVAAVTDMQAQTISFSSFVQIRVTRQQLGSSAVTTAAGLARDVIIPGGGASRISSRAP